MLAYEHLIVRADDLSRVNRAFFTANGFVGIQLFAFALADLIVQGLRVMTEPAPAIEDAVDRRGVRRVRHPVRPRGDQRRCWRPAHRWT